MMKRVDINLHHSDISEPPDDVVNKALREFGFANRKAAIMALKGWVVCCSINNWDAKKTPEYWPRYGMFMSGFNAGYNLHTQESREIAQGN